MLLRTVDTRSFFAQDPGGVCPHTLPGEPQDDGGYDRAHGSQRYEGIGQARFDVVRELFQPGVRQPPGHRSGDGEADDQQSCELAGEKRIYICESSADDAADGDIGTGHTKEEGDICDQADAADGDHEQGKGQQQAEEIVFIVVLLEEVVIEKGIIERIVGIDLIPGVLQSLQDGRCFRGVYADEEVAGGPGVLEDDQWFGCVMERAEMKVRHYADNFTGVVDQGDLLADGLLPTGFSDEGGGGKCIPGLACVAVFLKTFSTDDGHLQDLKIVRIDVEMIDGAFDLPVPLTVFHDVQVPFSPRQ